MEATIYRRHTKDCKSEDRYDPRCGCPLWYQFNWKGESGQFDGKKLKHGQNKWSSDLTSMSKAQAAWKKLSEDLDALLAGAEAKLKQVGVDPDQADTLHQQLRAGTGFEKGTRAEYQCRR